MSTLACLCGRRRHTPLVCPDCSQNLYHCPWVMGTAELLYRSSSFNRALVDFDANVTAPPKVFFRDPVASELAIPVCATLAASSNNRPFMSTHFQSKTQCPTVFALKLYSVV